jgi:L-lactate dehydrogenase complex protein LldG
MKKSELETMNRSFQILRDRRRDILKDEEVIKLKDKVKKIREYSISNLEDLIDTAKFRLEENGIEVIFAANALEALGEIYEILKDEPTVAKSKSNTISEIGLREFLADKGIKLLETDLGDYIVQLSGHNKPSHPIGPASHLNIEKIAQIVVERFKVEIEPRAESILKFLKRDIITRLSDCKVGLTGANAVAAEDGSIILVHNEGNISLVSMRDIHIVVVGIDKLVRTIEEAVSVVKLETIFATGTQVPAYMNVISSPSKTADIEQILIKDMYGAKRVVVILVDNGRTNAIEECLWCIGCGSCVVSCPVYNVLGYDFGYKGYLGGKGVVLSNFIGNQKICFDSGLFACTLCDLCTLECPVEIPTSELIEKLRSESVKSGFFYKKHHKIAKDIKEGGSPFL